MNPGRRHVIVGGASFEKRARPGMPERSRIFELAGPKTKMPGFGLFLGNDIGQQIFR
jgi:hypothetical protein